MPAKINKEKALIPRSFLQSGNDLPVSNSIHFKHPTVQEILDIDQEHLGLYSEDIYYSMINLFLTDPYTYMVYLDDKGIDYEKSTPFEVFILLYKDYLEKLKELSGLYPAEQINDLFRNNLYFKAFRFFLGVDSFFIGKDTDGNEVIACKDNQFLMDSAIYNYILEFVKKINGIPDGERIYPEDSWAKKLLIEDEREKIKKQAKKHDQEEEKADKNRLGNLLSSITWACNGGITPFNRAQLHMYDLVDGIHRMDKLLNYKNTMTGLYAGCIEKKKINWNELHWST